MPRAGPIGFVPTPCMEFFCVNPHWLGYMEFFCVDPGCLIYRRILIAFFLHDSDSDWAADRDVPLAEAKP